MWLPDSRRVALYPESARAGARIVVLDLRSGDTTSVPLPPLAAGMYGEGSWSPRGDRFAIYMERAEDPTGRMAIATTDGRYWLVDDAVPPPFASPQWSSTGDAIYGLSRASDLLRLNVGTRDRAPRERPQQIVQTLEAWSPRGDSRHAGTSLSADGRHVAFTREIRYGNLELVTPDGSRPPRRLTGNTTLKLSAVASPDGRRAAYLQSNPDGTHDVWVVNLGDNAVRRITRGGVATGVANRRTLAWSPDGSQLAFVDSIFLATVRADGDTGFTVHRGVVADYVTGLAWAPRAEIVHGVGREFRAFDPGTGVDSVIWQDSTLTQYTPKLSPDGNHLAFYVRGDDATRSGIYVMAIGGLPRHVLPDNADIIGWALDGHGVLAQRAGSRDLIAVSLDGRVRPAGRLPSNGMQCSVVGRALPGALLCTSKVSLADTWLLGLESR